MTTLPAAFRSFAVRIALVALAILLIEVVFPAAIAAQIGL